MEKYLKKIDDLLAQIDNVEAKDKLSQLKEDIIFDIALKDSRGAQKDKLRYAKQLLAEAKKDKKRPLIHKMYQVDNTYQLTDGYVGVVLNDKIKGLELNSAEGEYFDCRPVIDKSDFRNNYNYKKVEIDLMELSQQAIKTKAMKLDKNPIPIEHAQCIENTYYNPMNLLRAIKILGTNNVDIYFDRTGNNNIYLESELGKAIVIIVKKRR